MGFFFKTINSYPKSFQLILNTLARTVIQNQSNWFERTLKRVVYHQSNSYTTTLLATFFTGVSSCIDDESAQYTFFIIFSFREYQQYDFCFYIFLSMRNYLLPLIQNMYIDLIKTKKEYKNFFVFSFIQSTLPKVSCCQAEMQPRLSSRFQSRFIITTHYYEKSISRNYLAQILEDTPIQWA